MAFAGGEDAVATNKMHETLKLLHETIQTQTIATDKQSKVMIRLTGYLLVFTIVLCFLGLIQIAAMFIQYHDTLPHTVQKQNLNQQIPTKNKPIKTIQTLPKIVKEKDEGHK